ncbi:GNAT family N-acetyltransferase [Lysinibacillus sp. 2017]|uniref:GNAT family N-acetyltransferase n=1 Tax=unclassified Lysinibacillus TaxID=2636778 RepID=UPI000D527979|nr:MULTISPECIES: GNAT family N-acetyltransferase [unclassified Lysinibacillus]AWE06826.1 GNAT family N-acetyltransferase [Lysinibacillus sp. 2017]TGN37243.1 N-acetyltransferase [Lysinibacillus sp. S2017]
MIRQVFDNKKQFLPLLLLADEQESMIDRYLERGELFVLEEASEVRAICVVTNEGDGLFEIKNLATIPNQQRKGYGKQIVSYACNYFAKLGHTMQVGTGDSPLTIPFYEACGFIKSHSIENFFTENYDEPIFEAGKQLVHMIILRKKLN